MLKFELQTDRDRKEAAIIERRRRLEEERKKRIFDPRLRVLGVDYCALDKQIEEKRKREEAEERLNEAYAAQQLRDAQVAMACERKEMEERRRVEEELNMFRAEFQRKEDRREYDLYDPKALQRALPGRLSDDDPRCGPASAQKFDGEDLNASMRLKVQNEQQKAWLQQQIEEKRKAEEDRKMAEKAYEEAVLARDSRAMELDWIEKECRKKLDEAMARYNFALAQEQETRKLMKQNHDAQDRLAEIYNTMTSDFLTENPDVAQSNLGPHRQLGYMFKGMTPDQIEKIREEQLKQIADKKKQKEIEERLEQEWDEYINGYARSAMMCEEEVIRKQKEMVKNIDEENKLLSKEQKAHKEYLEKVVYTNYPTASYFDQFNTTTR